MGMSSLAMRLPSARTAQQFRQRREPAAGGDVRRRLQHQIAQHVGDHVEPLAVGGKPRGIARRELRDFLFGLAGADLADTACR